MTWMVPEPVEAFDVAMDDGATVRVRRHGRPDAPVRLFVSHGNGFAVDGYLPFWGPLAARADLVVFDFRNHGRNPLSDPARHHYAQMARDIETVCRAIDARLGRKTTVGVFHSMSARAAMKHAIEIGWRWDALALFDPPNVPPTDHPVYPVMEAFERLLADWAAKRRDRFADPSELAAEYLKARAHRTWVDGAHGLMARAVLRRDESRGDWALTCPPALESAIYTAALSLNLWPRADAFGGPVKLVGADPDAEGAPAPAFANRALGRENGFDYDTVPGTGHLMQIQKPEACRALLLDFLAKAKIAL
ncbi:MAG: alpha/beta fold hydrolase [Rhodospirillaceae bacterium]